MPGLAAPTFLIATLSIAAGCSQIAQKEDDRKEVGRALTDAYYSCVRSAKPKNRSSKHSKILSTWMPTPQASRAAAAR
jgi:hypothetical protein